MASTTPGTAPRTIKQLNSQVNQLRGWVGKDESKRAPLVHTLNELTAQRLLAHSFAEAAMDAQDAVTQAAKVIAEHGPVGPYTPMPDAAAYLSAIAHVATLQAGLWLPEAAGRTMDAGLLWARQLDLLRLSEHLTVSAAIWALAARARGAIANGDLALANACADAIANRTSEGGLASSTQLVPLAVDAERLIADARWAAGLSMDALAHTRTAMRIYDQSAGVDLTRPGLGRPKLEIALEPLPGLTRELVTRLLITGNPAEAVDAARAVVDGLAAIGGRAGDTGRSLMIVARADLARTLAAADDPAGAEPIAALACSEAAALVAKENPAGARLPLELATTPLLADLWLRMDRAEEAASIMDPLIARVRRLLKPGESAALLGSALLVQQRVERATDRLDEAAETRAMIGAIADSLRTPGQASMADDQVIADAALGLVSHAVRRSVHWRPLSSAEALAGSTSSHRAQPAPVVEPEPGRPSPAPAPARMAQPEAPEAPEAVVELETVAEAVVELETVAEAVVELETVAEPEAVTEPVVQPGPEPVAEPEPEPVVERGAPAEPRPVAELDLKPEPEPEPEPQPQPVAEPDALTETRPVAEPEPKPEPEPMPVVESQPAPEVDPQLALADQTEAAWQQAQGGDRKARAAAAEARVSAMRPLFQRQPRVYGPRLVAALDDLSVAKRQAGEWFGFRSPAKEARQIAKAIGLEA